MTIGGLAATFLGLVFVIGGAPVGLGLIMLAPFLVVVGLKLIAGVLEGDFVYGRGTWWSRR